MVVGHLDHDLMDIAMVLSETIRENVSEIDRPIYLQLLIEAYSRFKKKWMLEDIRKTLTLVDNKVAERIITSLKDKRLVDEIIDSDRFNVYFYVFCKSR